MPYADYLNLAAVADVLLDPLHYGGGVTSYDGLALGTPIVTLPSQYHRGRYTLGCYRKMNVLDCVASSVEEYEELALRLGTDRDYRQSVKEKILAANSVLFEDRTVVREHEEFFEQVIRAARSGYGKDARRVAAAPLRGREASDHWRIPPSPNPRTLW